MRFVVCVVAGCWFVFPASAEVVVRIDNSTQRMSVAVDGVPTFSWPVSTARKGYQTPVGSYRVQRMERMWYSRKYDMSPMPHALFFRGGYAIHGTYSVGQLGRPASHGCVRLSPGNAKTLFSLVRQHGWARIVVTGVRPPEFATPRRRPSIRARQPAPGEWRQFWPREEFSPREDWGYPAPNPWGQW